ncbi:hypothetical protein KR054_006795, partial [Drosophila jambulina]
VKALPEMFEFLRRQSVPKLSAIILRWMFHLARYLGILCFKLKATTDGQVAMEENGPWWKWFLAILRMVSLCLFTFKYIEFIVTVNNLLRKFLQIVRLVLNMACCLCLVRLHLAHGADGTHLINRFLQLFLKVQRLLKRKRTGFGGAHELVLLSLTLSVLIYEGVFSVYLFLSHKYWIVDIYVAVSNKLLMHLAVLGYMALGLLYADLNEYIRTEFRSQLEALEEHPTRRKLRKARKSLDTCLTLYKDVQSATSLFQRIYNLPLILGLGRNCSAVALVSYSTFINLDISLPWLLSNISAEIINFLLLTLSVQRTKIQFGTIRRLVMENCHLSENKEWHTTLEVFFTHLHLYEFQVRPLGLFEVSNELLVYFLSALITYLTVIIQYGMQLKAL